MPPKGWRKHADGYKPVNSAGVPLEEKEQFSLDELLFPRTTVAKICKDMLPEGTQVPKDGMTALLRSCTVFVNYLSSEANRVAQKSYRKTITPSDIYQALNNLEFGMFVPALKQSVEEFERERREKRHQKLIADSTAEGQERSEIDSSKRSRTDATSGAAEVLTPTGDNLKTVSFLQDPDDAEKDDDEFLPEEVSVPEEDVDGFVYDDSIPYENPEQEAKVRENVDDASDNETVERTESDDEQDDHLVRK